MKVNDIYKDFLNKILKIYKKDMYVVDNMYLLPGKYSDEELTGHTICWINIENIADISKPYNLYFLNSIKDGKTDFDSNCKSEFDTLEENEIRDKCNKLNKLIKQISSWSELIFSDDEKTSLFTNGETLELFKDDKKIPSVKISKTIFPLMTEKSNIQIYYNVQNTNDDVWRLTFKYQTDYFQFYNILFYLDL